MQQRDGRGAAGAGVQTAASRASVSVVGEGSSLVARLCEMDGETQLPYVADGSIVG